MREHTSFECVVWDLGHEAVSHKVVGTAAGMEIRMADGRTVQVFLYSDGMLQLRGWGNKPILVGNWDRVGFRADLQYEEPRCNEFGDRLPDPSSDNEE